MEVKSEDEQKEAVVGAEYSDNRNQADQSMVQAGSYKMEMAAGWVADKEVENYWKERHYA